jgi:single-stranded-DNA-specific exonuclease
MTALPDWLLETIKSYAPRSTGHHVAQILWQRGITTANALQAFLNPACYQPTGPGAFAPEIDWAVARLCASIEQKEQVTIWGDFDADGITATTVLYLGLGQFLAPEQLSYYIPDRLRESHGLNRPGIDHLAAQGTRLIVTCDTGSADLPEIIYAQSLGIEVIITDHHTLLPDRPPVVALINPRCLPPGHPLGNLSGVAVAYKLVEAMYAALPGRPQQPLTDLLDLVAVGLVADLVELTGDCRYLAQLGIRLLPQTKRLGLAKLLELCRARGHRPTDISHGIAPRINSMSRVYGDARILVEFFTSQDYKRVEAIARQIEAANTGRKQIEQDIQAQVNRKLGGLDLATTSVIILSDPDWPAGILGLIAGKVAREYGKPVILLAEDLQANPPLARGSARSVQGIDLYDLVRSQSHLLQSFGGHPLAAGLSLPLENLPLFTTAINQQLRQQLATHEISPPKRADLTLRVVDLGPELYEELRLLEPCGMGNPSPQLLLRNCRLVASSPDGRVWGKGKTSYIRTEFTIYDDSTSKGFAGVWWDHHPYELPAGSCDVLVKLDFDNYKQQVQLELLEIISNEPVVAPQATVLDWRSGHQPPAPGVLVLDTCPTSWDEVYCWLKRSQSQNQPLALAYPAPDLEPQQIYQQLVGVAKFLSRTGKTITKQQLQGKLQLGDRTLALGLETLATMGCHIIVTNDDIKITTPPTTSGKSQEFLAAVGEEIFRKKYFHQAPINLFQLKATLEPETPRPT